MKQKIIACLLCLLTGLTLHAEVYKLFPFNRKSASLTEIAEYSQPKKFWTEQIRVNGKMLTLEIFLLETTLEDLAKTIAAGVKPEVQTMHGARSILLQEKQPDGSMKRVYYLALNGIRQVLQFQMVLPAERLIPARKDWHDQLPYMEDAKDVTCMEFPVRGAVFGAFQLEKTTVAQTLDSMSSKISALGWEQIGRERDQVFTGSGEVFMKSNPQSMLILGVTQNGDGVRVSMYTRPLE